MIENPNKYKLRKLEKIYSPKREGFKIVEKPYNTSPRPRLSVIAKIISKAKNLKNLPACVFSLGGKGQLINKDIQNSKVLENTKPTYTTLLYSNVAKVKTGAKLLQRIQELSSCNPLRNLKMKSKMILKKGFALITILAVLVTAYFQSSQTGQAASYEWAQIGWAGGTLTTQGTCEAAGGTWANSECGF